MSATEEMASDCINLSYKYGSLRSCVQDQRPALLCNDPVLGMLNIQIAALEAAFDNRVRALADTEPS